MIRNNLWKLVNSYPDDKNKENEECLKFIEKNRLNDDSDSRRELAKRFIDLLL